MGIMLRYLFIYVLVFSIVIRSGAVPVDSVKCPTNKIAPPRRRMDGGGQARPRTLGLIYDLFGTRNQPLPNNPMETLQERPQQDDPEDCGEIEDYDETDLSSITPGANRKSDRKIRVINHGEPVRPPLSGPPIYSMTLKPMRLKKPSRPLTISEKPQSYSDFSPRPFMGYRQPGSDFFPTKNKYWIDHVKPVTEDIVFDEPPKPFRLGLVGGVVSQVVGFVPKQVPSIEEVLTPKPDPIEVVHPEAIFRFPGKNAYKQKRKKPKSLNRRSTGIIDSFVDLLF